MDLHRKFSGVLKITEKLTSLLLFSSGRSGPSIGSAGESTGSGAALEQAGKKMLPESDARTRLMQLYAKCKIFRITLEVLQRTSLYIPCVFYQAHDQRLPKNDF